MTAIAVFSHNSGVLSSAANLYKLLHWMHGRYLNSRILFRCIGKAQASRQILSREFLREVSLSDLSGSCVAAVHVHLDGPQTRMVLQGRDSKRRQTNVSQWRTMHGVLGYI